jgi:hypothetical protein
MQHKGEIIEKAIRQSGFPITKVAKKMGKSTRWMYYLFDSHNVSLDYVLEIGEIIHHDFSDQITELKKYKIQQRALTSEDITKTDITETVEYWKDKYFELLDQHHKLLLKFPAKK